jgi:hypothetical protein
MSHEIAKASDAVAGGLIAGTKHTEVAKATGRFRMECYDKDGNLKWTAESQNLVVNVGLQYMAGTALTSTAQITSWYIGLYGAAASNTPAAGDTMALHGGWTEIAPYSNATRPTATFVAATNANPSVVTNSASPASFSINATATVGGAFLTSSSPKIPNAGFDSGTLFSAADFQAPGDRNVVSGDTLNVTYTFSLAG